MNCSGSGGDPIAFSIAVEGSLHFQGDAAIMAGGGTSHDDRTQCFPRQGFNHRDMQSVVAIGLGITALRVEPQFEKIFKNFGAKLPDMTILVINVVRFLGWYWYLLVLPVLLWPFVNWGIVSVLSPRPEVVMPRRLWYFATWGVILLVVIFAVVALFILLTTLVNVFESAPVVPGSPPR